jgi:hypothetical protein
MPSNKIFIYFGFLVVILLASLSVLKIIKGGTGLQTNEDKEDIIYMVSHSLYKSGEQGQIITRLLNFRGEPISANYCRAYISYPNKTMFVDGSLMTSNIVQGTYYYEFTTPDITGVYEYQALCNYGSPDKNRTAMSSFQVSPALNLIQISYDNLSNQITNLSDLETVHFGDTQINLSKLYEDTQYIRNNLAGAGNESYAEVISMLGSMANFCGDNVTSSSLLCQWVNETNSRVIDINTTITLGFSNIQNNMTYQYNEIINDITNLDQQIINVYNNLSTQITNVQTQVNTTDAKVDLILQYMNISTDEINIYATSSGNCILDANWILNAQVKNEINIILDDNEVWCNVTTNLWGTDSMSYDLLDLRFEYNHICDQIGIIIWQIQCEAT